MLDYIKSLALFDAERNPKQKNRMLAQKDEIGIGENDERTEEKMRKREIIREIVAVIRRLDEEKLKILYYFATGLAR